MPNTAQPPTPAPAAQTPPPKEVIAPPPPSAGPMHKHTGFIIAIVITVILLLVAAVLGYLSYDQGLKVAQENVALQNNNRILQEQNDTLQTALNAEIERPGPIPFYYIENSGDVSYLHAIDAISGQDNIVLTIPTIANQPFATYRILAQPRTHWNNTIVLDRIPDGTEITRHNALLLDVVDGSELQPAPINDVMPIGIGNLLLSKDERHAFAVYDTVDNPTKELALLNIITGERILLETLAPDQRYTPIYDDYGTGDVETFWLTHECLQVTSWSEREEGQLVRSDQNTHCISDHITE